MDLVIAVFVFLLLAGVVLTLILTPDDVEKEVTTLRVSSDRLAEKLSVGPNAIIRNGEVDLERLAQLSELSFPELQELFQEEHPFCISLENSDGELITIAKRTGVGSDELLISGTPCGEVLDCDEDGDGQLSDVVDCGGVDCNDNNPYINSFAASEYCDCNPSTPAPPSTGYAQGRPEICNNGIDEDCDGTPDNGCPALPSPPSIDSVQIVPFPTALSSEDLTCQAVNPQDPNGDFIILAGSWRLLSDQQLWDFFFPMTKPSNPADTTVVDVSGRGNDGRLRTALSARRPSFEEQLGSRLGVLSFEGNTSRGHHWLEVESPDLDSTQDQRDFSFALWVYQKDYADPQGRGLVYRNESWRVFSNSSTIYVERYQYSWGETFPAGAAIPLNTWTHYAVTFQRVSGPPTPQANLSQFINGVLVNTTIIPYGRMRPPPNVNNERERMYIGTGHRGMNDWNGSIDDVIYVTRALSPEQILLLAQGRSDVLSGAETLSGEDWLCMLTPLDATGLIGSAKETNNPTSIS